MLTLPIDARRRLALLEDRHAEPFFALVEANRAHLEPWLGWVALTPTLAEARTLLALFEQFAEADTGYTAGLWLDDHLIGVLDVHDVNRRHHSLSLGYWIASAYEGGGHVAAGCRALLRHLFTQEGFHRVEIRCTPQNRRSRALAERLGFTEEGHVREARRLNGRYVDLVIYGLLADDGRLNTSRTATAR